MQSSILLPVASARGWLRLAAVSGVLLAVAALLPIAAARAAEPQGFLESIHRHTTLTSSVPDNGDQIPTRSSSRPSPPERSRRTTC